MKWAAEGGKELLWVAIKKVYAKERLLVCKNWKYLRTAKKGTCKRNFFVRKKAALSEVRKVSANEFFDSR